MDVRITWAIPLDILVTDEFDVLYKVADPNDLNNWIIANPTPLPSTTNFYDIQGLDPNTVYRFAITKSCFGTQSVIDQGTWYSQSCPIISLYQGPPTINQLLPTLFYSIYYQDSNHVAGASVNIFDSTNGNAGDVCFPALNISAAVVGRSVYQTVNKCLGPPQSNQYQSCNTQGLDTYPLNSALTSALGYFGLDGNSVCCNSNGFYDPIICAPFGAATDPIVFDTVNSYSFYVSTIVKDPSNNPPPLIQAIVTNNGECRDPFITKLPVFPIAAETLDPARISGSICTSNCQASLSLRDGTNQTWAPGYVYTYYLEDAASNQIQITTDSNGNPVTGSTTDFTFDIDTLINMSPALLASQLGPGMIFNLWVTDPALNNPYTSPAVDFTSFTWPQVVAFIANEITNNTAFTATPTTLSGNEYIKLIPCTNLTSAYITLTAANLFEGPNDIPQVDPTSAARHGIADAFIYDSGAGDKIYGTRGLAGSNKGLIQVTDITSQTTLEYNHDINIPINQMTLVNEAPPTTAYAMTHFPDDPNGIHALTMGIVTNPIHWNIDLVYVCEDYDSKIITVYDSSNVQVDSYNLNPVGPIRYIEVRQATGEIMVLCESGANVMDMYLVNHSGITFWSDSLVGSVACNNDAYVGTITGVATFTVLSSTPTSITVTPNPGWAIGQWDNYRIHVDTGALAGSQAVTWLYDLPNGQLNYGNNANTLFINNTYPVTFDASLLAPGDIITLLGEADTFAFVYENGAPYTPGQYNGYDLVFEYSPISPILAGARWTVENTSTHPITGTPFLRLNQYNTGGYYAKTSIQNSTLSNLLPGATYRVYRNSCGAFFYNEVFDSFYFSTGGGSVEIFTGGGTSVSSFQMLDPTGSPISEGAFHFTAHPVSGEVYAIMRGSDMSEVGSPYIKVVSSDIYRIDAGGSPMPAIDGGALWGEYIAGRLSWVSGKLYFTSTESRTLIEYDVSGGTHVLYPLTNAPVYKKSESIELIEGAVHLGGDQFVIMNRLENSTVTTTKTKYLFTNLFIYDIGTDTVDTVLIGAPADAYNAGEAAWNSRNLGEMFAEFNGYKDYCSGLSIKTYNGSIYYKQYAEESYYRFTPTAETGVAQIWCIGRNLTSGADASTYRVIRIFNIQADGSLQSSVRNIYTYRTARGLKQGPVYIQYSSYYQGVLGVTDARSELFLINCSNFTGYYGGPNLELANLVFTSYLSINTKKDLALADLTNQIEDPARFVLDPSGIQVTMFGKESGAQRFNFRIYDDIDIQSPNNSVTNSGVTGNPAPASNPGLFNTGSYADYLPVWDSNNNTIWMMGNLTRNNGAIEGDRIIRVFNAGTMSVVTTINLTTLSAIPTGATHLYWNFFHVPAMDMMVFYGKGNDKLVMIDCTSYALRYNGPILPIINLNRSPLLGAQNYGWMVPYNNGFFLDRNDNGTTDEFWTYIDDATGGVQYNGAAFGWLTINVNGTDILIHDDLSNPTLYGNTFGQWKVVDAPAIFPSAFPLWNNMVGGSTITVAPNETIEFTQFSMDEQLVKVENLTTGDIYDITDPAYLDVATLPTYNTLNSVPFFAIKADYINLNPGDQLEFTFKNLVYPNCPFKNNITVTF